IVAHSDVAPDRKEDPGEKFDWVGLAQNGVGVWPWDVPDLGTTGAVRDAGSLRDVRAALAEIGYRVTPEGALDPALASVLRAFQRHWRPRRSPARRIPGRSRGCSGCGGWSAEARVHTEDTQRHREI